jgi:hypothetical protein
MSTLHAYNALKQNEAGREKEYALCV